LGPSLADPSSGEAGEMHRALPAEARISILGCECAERRSDHVILEKRLTLTWAEARCCAG
jgi:hypothetical protein